ncbi:MAG: type 4a pilus biogenesis protein PilO [candidate division Zixibacteria bacterium]|nr:type 4a pilus biogenesis protein PilO [candidate division Zixibacteria bacterium]
MDLKDPKFQKIALGFIVFFIMTYFWYSRVYTLQANKIEEHQREYQTMISNLRNVEMKSKSLEALQAEYESLLSEYRKVEQLLPEVKMVPSFLVQLHTASSLTGTKIISITPQAIQSESFYNIANFDVELAGGYHEFGKFISYIANFPFIVNVSEMKLETSTKNVGRFSEASDTKSENDDNSVTAKFTLSTYFVKADERLKELEI